MKRIVFIINTIPNQRCLKRITEFIENGYKIDAYSFVRKEVPFKQPDNFTITILGEFKDNGGYKNRIRIIINSIKSINRNYKNSTDVIFYYFGLDIALFASYIIRKKYVYEESDLPQTYISNKLLKKILDWMDKRIIKKSFESIFTSEGFIKYHFGYNPPNNITVIPNRINIKCLHFEKLPKKRIDLQNLKIGFVGLIRYKSIFKFAEVFSKNFPYNEFHFFGTPIENQHEINKLKKISNIYFHGEFKNPDDLPAIYQSINLVLSTYDVKIENVKYAEPNKIYESIFFQTPIIVSQGTFLSEKVEMLGIGYSINALDKDNIMSFINNLTIKNIEEKIINCAKLPESYSIDSNKVFFQKIEKKINNIR